MPAHSVRAADRAAGTYPVTITATNSTATTTQVFILTIT